MRFRFRPVRQIAPQKCETKVHGRTIVYRVAGDGPSVVLVHGLSASWHWWDRNIEPLAAHFRVYALDLPGFGENRSPGLLQLDQTAAWLCAWMDAIGLDRTHLIGHSMGGFIVGQVAAADPNRVDRLVLVDAVVRPYARPYWGPVANLWAEMRHTPLAFVPTLVNDAARAGLWTLHRATRAVVRADSRPRLTGITAPTLVIWGAQDSLVAPVDAEDLVHSIPECELVVIEGAGHNPMWDKAEEFNRLVLEFLGRDVEESGRLKDT